ncbi:hypothetical protein Tco_0494957, partial [Tanacetum coccineum]
LMESNQSSDQSSVSFDAVDVSSGLSDNVLTSLIEEIVAYEQDSDQTQAVNNMIFMFHMHIIYDIMVEGSEVSVIKVNKFVYEETAKKKKKSQSADEVADKEKEDEKVDLFYKDGLYKEGGVVAQESVDVQREGIVGQEYVDVQEEGGVAPESVDVQEEGVVAQESVEVQEEGESLSEDDKELV